MGLQIEWFDREIGNPMVSIGEYGIGLNKATIVLLGEEPGAVKIEFDKTNSIVAVQRTNDSEKQGIAYKPKNNYVRINSKEFVRLIQRHYQDLKYGQYIAQYDEENQYIFVDLKYGPSVELDIKEEKENDESSN